MGTRHLIAVKVNDEIKVAQYGQWDGYPSGQGVDILNALRALNIENLKKCVAKCRFISSGEIHDKWVSCGADDSGLVSMETDRRFKTRYPELHRDTGAKILTLIAQNQDGFELCNDIDFANDYTFCEWAYVVDLDRMVLETYNSYDFPDAIDDSNAVLKDYSVGLRRVDDINNLPSNDEFCKFFEYDDDDEE